MDVKPRLLLSLGSYCKQASDERHLLHDVSFSHATYLPFPHHDHHLYWLLRTSVRERDALGLRHPPLSLFQVVLSHRSRRKMFLMHKRKQACVCSKPSGKACKGCMRGLPKTSSGMRLRVVDEVHQLDARTHGPASDRPAVVMVQPTHDWKSDHLVPCILSGRDRAALFGDLLSNPLMRPCPVEGGHIGLEHAARVASHAGSTGGPGILAEHSSKSVRRWRWGVSHEPAF